MIRNIHKIILTALIAHIFVVKIFSETPKAYDIDMAKELCGERPLDKVEGIWIYPEDKVTVMILNDEDLESANMLPVYNISVVETGDARLHPGDEIGKLYSTPEEKTFKLELATEFKDNLMLKPKSCMATLTSDGETFIIKKQKSPFKGRLNLNFNRLLPGFWKIVSTGISMNGNQSSSQPPLGMVKIFPSYDGNGSSRRKIRYL